MVIAINNCSDQLFQQNNKPENPFQNFDLAANQKPDRKPDPGPSGKFYCQMNQYIKRNFTA